MKKPINRIVLIIEFSKDINKLGSPTHRTNYALIIDFICKFIDQKMIYDPTCEIGIILAGCPRNARRERIINGAFLMEPLQTVNLRLYENILLGGIPRIDEAGDVDFDRALVVALNCLEASLKQSALNSHDNRNTRRQIGSSQDNNEGPTLNKTKENVNPNIKTEEEKQNQIIFITYGSKEVHFTPERLQRHLNLKNVTCIVIGLTFKKELFLDDLTKLREFRVNTSREIYNQTQWNEFVLLCNGSIYTYDEALNKILEPKVVNQERKRSICRIHFIIPYFVRFNIRLYPYTNVKHLPRFTVVSKMMKKPKGKTDVKFKKNFQLDGTKKNQRQEDIIQPTFFFDKELKFDKASNVHICSKYLEDSKEILKKKRSAREAELNEISRKKPERENNNTANEDPMKISRNLIYTPKDLSEYFRYAKKPTVPCEQIKKKLKYYTSNMPAEVRCLCVCKISEIQSKYVVGNTYYVIGSNKGAAIILNYLVHALKEQNSFFLALYKAKQNGRVYLVGLIPMIGQFPSLNLFFFASNEYIYYFNWKSKQKENYETEKEAVFRPMFDQLIDVMDGTNLYKKEIKEIENSNEQNERSIKRNYDFFLPESLETINKNSTLLTKNIYNLSVKIFHDMIIQKFKAFCKTSKTEYDNNEMIDSFIKPNVETRDIETLIMNKELIQNKKEQMESLKSTIQSTILYLKDDDPTLHVNKSNQQSQNTRDKYCVSHNLLNKVLEIGSDDNTTKMKNWFNESKTTGKIKILRDHKIYVIKNEDLWIQREKENANESTSKSVLRMLSEKIKRSLRWY